MKISEISFGAWAIGADWGSVDDNESMAALRKAVELGVNSFGTADGYGMGRSERLVARLRKESSETIYVATRAGRRLSPHVAREYTPANIGVFVEDSLNNMETETLDLRQLHCPRPRSIIIPSYLRNWMIWSKRERCEATVSVGKRSRRRSKRSLTGV